MVLQIIWLVRADGTRNLMYRHDVSCKWRSVREVTEEQFIKEQDELS